MCINQLSRSFLLLLLCLAGTYAAAQTKDCQVVDKQGESIPFVTVYAPGSQAGVITDVDGHFDLASGFQVGDTLRFSCLSYTDNHVALRTLAAAGNCRVVLASDAIDLDRIVVTDEVINLSDSTVGYREELPLTFYDFHAPGAENGVVVSSDSPMLIDRVNIQFGPVTVDTIVLELNFYELNAAGRPVRYLQQKRVVRKIPGLELHGAVRTIDLTDQRVRTEGPVLISLKTLAVDDDGKGKMFVGAKMEKDKALFRTAGDGWEDPGIYPLIEAEVRVEE